MTTIGTKELGNTAFLDGVYSIEGPKIESRGFRQQIMEDTGVFTPTPLTKKSFMQFFYSMPGGYFPTKRRYKEREPKRQECNNIWERRKFVETRKFY